MNHGPHKKIAYPHCLITDHQAREVATAAAAAEASYKAGQAAAQQRIEANRAAMERRRNGNAELTPGLFRVANFISSSAKAVLGHAVGAICAPEDKSDPSAGESCSITEKALAEHTNCICEFCREELIERFGRKIKVYSEDMDNNRVLVEDSVVDFDYTGREEVKSCSSVVETWERKQMRERSERLKAEFDRQKAERLKNQE